MYIFASTHIMAVVHSDIHICTLKTNHSMVLSFILTLELYHRSLAQPQKLNSRLPIIHVPLIHQYMYLTISQHRIVGV